MHALNVFAKSSSGVVEEILLVVASLSAQSTTIKRRFLRENSLKPLVLKLFVLHQQDPKLQAALCKFLSVVLLDGGQVTEYFDADIIDFVIATLEMHFDQPDTLGYVCHALSALLHCVRGGTSGVSCSRKREGHFVLGLLVSKSGIRYVMSGFARHFRSRIACFGILQFLHAVTKSGNRQVFTEFLALHPCCPLPWLQNATLETLGSEKLSGPEIIVWAMFVHSEHVGVQQLGILLLQYCLVSLCSGKVLSQMKSNLRSSPALSQALLHCQNLVDSDSSMSTKANSALVCVNRILPVFCDTGEETGEISSSN